MLQVLQVLYTTTVLSTSVRLYYFYTTSTSTCASTVPTDWYRSFVDTIVHYQVLTVAPVLVLLRLVVTVLLSPTVRTYLATCTYRIQQTDGWMDGWIHSFELFYGRTTY